MWCRTFIFIVVLALTPAAAFAQSGLGRHNTDQAIDIVADNLEVRQNDDIAVFRGAVEASQGDLKLAADMLTVHYAGKSQDGNPTIGRIDANGHVLVSSATEKAEGEWGVYEVSSGKITIGGNVVLTRDENVLEGQRLEIDLKTGVMRFDGSNVDSQNNDTGRVSGRFSIPQDETDNAPSEDDGGK